MTISSFAFSSLFHDGSLFLVFALKLTCSTIKMDMDSFD